ncbi:MAG: ABC transporter permease [Balneolales bacterium]
MKFEWFLALRYFRGGRKDSSFLSFIKVMAISGVAVGVAGLLISLSIVHGFKSVIQEKILGFGNNITVMTYSDSPIYRADTVLTRLAGIPEISEIQEVVYGQAMVQTRDFVEGSFIKGVGPEGDLSDIHQYVNRGRYDFSADENGLPGVVIGSRLARNLNARIGSALTVYTLQGVPSPVNMPEIIQFHIAGIYQTGVDMFDDLLVLMERDYARVLFDLPPPSASQIDVQATGAGHIRDVDAAISEALPFPYYTETIYQRYSSIFAWINLQEQTIPFVIAVMIIVAAFNLIGTVLMMVLERTKDIGILKTMGAGDKNIRSVFLIEGLIVGLTGLILGIVLSLLFYWLQATWQIIPLPEETYYMSSAPVEPHVFDFAIVSIVTMLLCALASWLPARVAARMNPLSVISYGR